MGVFSECVKLAKSQYSLIIFQEVNYQWVLFKGFCGGDYTIICKFLVSIERARSIDYIHNQQGWSSFRNAGSWGEQRRECLDSCST